MCCNKYTHIMSKADAWIYPITAFVQMLNICRIRNPHFKTSYHTQLKCCRELVIVNTFRVVLMLHWRSVRWAILILDPTTGILALAWIHQYATTLPYDRGICISLLTSRAVPEQLYDLHIISLTELYKHLLQTCENNWTIAEVEV